MSLCDRGIDSLMQFSEVIPVNHKIGYVDGHCLGEEKSLLLYNENWFQVFEYGNFKKGHYEVDSVVLPTFRFKVFESRQQVPTEDYGNRRRVPIEDLWETADDGWYYFLREVGGFRSIVPYKDKIIGITKLGVLIVEPQRKQLDFFMYYEFFIPIEKEEEPIEIFKSITGGKVLTSKIHFDLIRIKNDTLVLSYKEPREEHLYRMPLPGEPHKFTRNGRLLPVVQEVNYYMDTILITLDGKSIVPKIKEEDFCFGVRFGDNFGNGKEGYIGANCPIQDNNRTKYKKKHKFRFKEQWLDGAPLLPRPLSATAK
jgi:hypothetical protein